MDILILLAKLAVGGIVLVVAGLIIWEGAIWLFALLPFAVGIPAGVYLWNSGHDNLAVIVWLATFVGGIAWIEWSGPKGTGNSGSSYDPMSGKTKVYDRDGNIKGYVDKD